jgi:dipeptidyl aminopeptidase/acylaminoacyl peptidase
VENDWATRDLAPSGIREELRDHVRFGSWDANIRIVSHLVHGSRHYGAIIYPDGASTAKLPVILVAKGVSPTYFPLNIGDQTDDGLMGSGSDKYIYALPSYRGEVLNFRDRTFTSEGDRRDALDGATDDTLALLTVALETTPLADPERVCIYGQSRGGNVALLAGIRDKRIKCVVDVSGPTDWFYLMGTNGWTEQELWTEAVRTHANTLETGGQNLERFMGRAIEGKADLAAVRRNMIASSPLYFAKRLPRTQLHYGLEDPFVPVRNGRKLVEAMRAAGVPASRYEAHFYPNEGHDTDRINGPALIRRFISASLKAR